MHDSQQHHPVRGVPGLHFTAVDFETANGFRGSPCAVGLVRIRDGREVDSFYTTMRPPLGFDRFDPRNVAIHGITPEQVADAPRFGEVFGEIIDFIGEDTLVAHNAAFDLEVFESSLEVSGLDCPGMRCLCSVSLSRATYEIPSHALPQAAAEAGYELTRHHWALEDARACAAIVVDIARRRQEATLETLFGSCGVETTELASWEGIRDRESRATRQVRAFAHLFDSRIPDIDPQSLPDLMRWQDEGRNPQVSAEADPQHPLYGHHVVFTGNLGIPRAEAKKLCARLGASTSSRVTGSTSLLVVGDGFEPSDMSDPEACEPLRSSKARDALRRRDSGQPLRVLCEEDFRELIGAEWPQGLAPLPAALSNATAAGM
ncbi:exonuclease domain-containing protein [Nesterenkonia flava]